ncbi:MAG: virulence RhuM family protein [Methanobrevibacter sp.]|nr:virulence RhuM family protein [Methanobrevibacter sp.]
MRENELEIVDKLLYVGDEGAVSVQVILGEETIWANQKSLAELFNVTIPTINKHLRNIFQSNELNENSVIRKFLITATDGKKYLTNFYHLDAILSVGYRINSKEATLFRKWANSVLKEYIVKGYVLDKDLLKKGGRFTKDYFDKLLEEIKEIRASERRTYEKITDIYATSYDYKKDAKITKEFFSNVQNKLHFAVTGKTAPEIIKERAAIDKPHMGLETWENAPHGKILQRDVLIAKNYLKKEELEKLNRIVLMLIDYAENQAYEQRPMSMKDWVSEVDRFLEFNRYQVLKDKGKTSKKEADKDVKEKYKKFRVLQDKNYKSDFNEFLEESQKLLNN